MDIPSVRVLLIEDDEDDFVVVKNCLAKVPSTRFELDWVRTYSASLEALGSGNHDVCLLDYRLGESDGLEILKQTAQREIGRMIPIIFLTGQGNHTLDVEAMKAGACDYLVKARIDTQTLERSIRYAIANRRVMEALEKANEELERKVEERTRDLRAANDHLMLKIEERKRAEAALLESEQRVRRLNEQILNMVMVLSHDIRGPLVAIASILKLMLRGAYGKLDQSPTNTVQDLLSRCARLLGTAEDYLGKASIVGGSMEMEREVLDLRQDIIDAVLEELADDITRREIVIDNRLGTIPAGSIAICANKTWLKAVYRNLFTNAVKYGGKGCTISFGFEQRESHYRLNVYNSGRPIAEKDREKLFTKFGRIEASEGPAPDGIGLGLCLCREIILEHGGEIWYEARPDGSNFVFTVSLEDEREA